MKEVGGEAAPASRSVLIVEDDYLIASALALLLSRQGARVLGPVACTSDALDLIAAESHIDCALLDIRLRGESVFAVADALRKRGVRFAFLSGYDRSALPPAYRDAMYFNKVEDPNVLTSWVLGS